MRAGLNILVAGATQAGKTTMLNCLAAAIPGGERVVSAEEVFELRFNHPDWVAMQTRQSGLEGTGEIPLRDLVKESLRMRPSRIIVGEVRAEECLDLLLALNAGLPGMCTLHANSAREALVKMCTLPLLAGENISARFVVPTVAACVDLVVHLGIDQHGVRRVNEIVAVPGRVENDIIEIEPIFVRHGGELRRAAGCRRGSSHSSASASTSTRCSTGRAGGRAGRARRRCRAAAGLVGVRVPAGGAACARTPSRLAAAAGCAGLVAVSVTGLVALCAVLRRSPDLSCRSCHGTPPVAVAFAAMAAYLPIADRVRPGPPPAARVRRGVARGGRQPRLAPSEPGCPCPTPWPGSGRARARAAACRPSTRSPSTTRSPAASASASTGSRTGWPTPSATGSSRACASPARSAAASSAGCCATSRATCATRPAPAPSSSPARRGPSTVLGSPSPRRGWCC